MYKKGSKEKVDLGPRGRGSRNGREKVMSRGRMSSRMHWTAHAGAMLLFLLLSAAALWAGEDQKTSSPEASGSDLLRLTEERLAEADFSGAPVTNLEIDGLKKTKSSSLYSLILIEEGKPLRKSDVEETRQNLKETELFQKIAFFYGPADKGYRVRIELKEKASFVPIPFFAASDGSYSFGIGVFNANLFGLRKQLVTTAMVADGNPSGTIGYIDPTLADSNLVWTLFVSGGPSSREHAYPDGRTYRRFMGTDARISTRFGFRSKAHIQPSIGFVYEHTTVDDDWNDSVAPPDSSSLVAPRVGLTFRYARLIDYFYRGFVADFDYAYAFLTDSSYDGEGGEGSFAEGRVMLNTEPFAKQRLAFSAVGGISRFPTPSLRELSGPGFRVLPFGRAVGRRYAAGSAAYEFPFAEPDWGVLTLSGFFDGGVYEPLEDEWDSFYGPGAGFRLYLKKIVIPAVGIDLAVDLPTETLQASVVIGMQM